MITGSLNNDELGIILSFVPPQDLIKSVQLVSKNFHQSVTNQEILWKKYCDEYYLADFFDWEHNLFTKSLQIDEESKYFTLFNAWSKSIPRIELVGRYPKLSTYQSKEQERSIFARFDTAKYSFKNLTQLVILLNVFSLTKYDNDFNTGLTYVKTDSPYYPFDEQVANAIFTPYDFVPSIWGDSVTITLSDKRLDFQTGNAVLNNEQGLPIAKEIPFGAFCLMILSENQQESISLIRNTFTESEDKNYTLGVSAPNADKETMKPVCYFNRMQKCFSDEDRTWVEDKDYPPEKPWLPLYKFVRTEYVFSENADLKKVTMERTVMY